MIITDGADSIELEIEYNTDLFDEAQIERMVGHFCTLLEGAIANLDQQVANLPMLTSAERHQLLVEWNADQDDQVA